MTRRALLLVSLGLAVAGCGSNPAAKQRRAAAGIPKELMAEARPIGRGVRFQPPLRGHVPGACRAPLGRRLQAHVEVFGANRVVLLAAGIGTRPPRRRRDGRIVSASCFGDLVTLDPTGTVYFRRGRRLTTGDLFSAWGQALSPTRIASFSGGRVRAYVNGRRWSGSPRAVPLYADAEIVLEIGPRVPPHSHFSFPPAPQAGLH